jgi:hypothetical protein
MANEKAKRRLRLKVGVQLARATFLLAARKKSKSRPSTSSSTSLSTSFCASFSTVASLAALPRGPLARTRAHLLGSPRPPESLKLLGPIAPACPPAPPHRPTPRRAKTLVWGSAGSVNGSYTWPFKRHRSPASCRRILMQEPPERLGEGNPVVYLHLSLSLTLSLAARS